MQKVRAILISNNIFRTQYGLRASSLHACSFIFGVPHFKISFRLAKSGAFTLGGYVRLHIELLQLKVVSGESAEGDEIYLQS